MRLRNTLINNELLLSTNKKKGMDQSRLEYLFRKYVQGICTPSEQSELMEIIRGAGSVAEVHHLIEQIIQSAPANERMDDERAENILNEILGRKVIPISAVPGKRGKRRFWFRAAAAAVLVAAATYWFIDRTGQNNQGAQMVSAQASGVILPGGDRATLTLADGSTIVLDSLQNGSVQQSGLRMSKQDGLLVFEGVQQNGATATVISWNTLSTPRGGQYKVVLPDGSEVWLNASSSLRFPNEFNGAERKVEITGEAYFEVAKNRQKPFFVQVGEMQVRVLGTHFNINAYPDGQGIKTSLLEGSVRIIDGASTGLLKPGQQGVVKSGSANVEIRQADMEEVMAWKNGLFIFNGDNINTIMNQIGRWYDVEVSFGGNIPHRSFEGKISRNAPLSDVLKILELSGVKFSVVGKRIIVE